MAFRNLSKRQTRVAVLIDLSNLNGAFGPLKARLGGMYNTRIDFDRLIKIATPGCKVVHKAIYVERRIDIDAAKMRSQHNFIENLRSKGFRVVTKEAKNISQPDGTMKVKADMDVEITTDASELIWRRDCDEIILISGDSDFAYLLDRAIEYGVNITVVSTRGSLSRELAERAQRTILLDDLDIKDFTIDSSSAPAAMAASV